jgi:putative phosphonate metabolism protein
VLLFEGVEFLTPGARRILLQSDDGVDESGLFRQLEFAATWPLACLAHELRCMPSVSQEPANHRNQSRAEEALAPRYAVYWAPAADFALGQLGERWLGRDAATGSALQQPTLPGFSHTEVALITAEPRRYGLHATLKAPFHLASQCGLADLETHLASFAKAQPRFRAPPLRVTRLANFLALTLQAPSPALHALAAKCVETFDCFRSLPDGEELARRRRYALTPRQEENLCRWGYPYVMDEFRFHVSLTGAIDRDTADRLQPILAEYFAVSTSAPLEISEIALFVEPGPGTPLQVVRRYSLSY